VTGGPLTIILGIPDRRLSPNVRQHWAALAKAKKKARAEACVLAKESMQSQGFREPPMWKYATVHVRAYFTTKRGRDVDNFIASMKGTCDGIAEAGVLENDRGLRWGTVDLEQIDRKYPRVELTFIPDEK